MQDDLCELRLDVPLEEGMDARGFERLWRETLAAQRLNPSARPVAVRFRLCGEGLDEVRATAWTHYLTARLAALPGGPSVAAEAVPTAPDWRGIRVWLAYRPHDLTALLRRSRPNSPHPKSARARGHRP